MNKFTKNGFAPIIFIVIGAIVLGSVTFGVIKYKNNLTASVSDIGIQIRENDQMINDFKTNEQEKNLPENTISQKTETSEQNQSAQTCAGNLCNGTCYVNCPEGKSFYCLNNGGACCSPERYCNGRCWDNCSTGTFRCPVNGDAYCENASSNEILDMFNKDLEMAKGLVDSMEQINEQALLEIAIRAKQKDEEYDRTMAEFKRQQEELNTGWETAKAKAAIIENNPIYIKCEQNISACAGSDLTEWMKMNSELTLIWNNAAITAGGAPYVGPTPKKESFNYSVGATMPTIVSPNGLGGWNINSSSGNYIMSPNGLGGYSVNGMGSGQNYMISPNGLGGYIISGF